MPGMSGLQATGAIRALPGGADVPILALTAQAMKGDRERILAAGCDDYLAKPVQPNELIAGRRPAACAPAVRMRRFPRARRLPPGRARPVDSRSITMARILLVDNDAGDPALAAAQALGVREQELEHGRVDRGGAGAGSRRRGHAVRAAVARQPRGVAASRPSPAATSSARRSTCSRTASAWWPRNGALKVANAIGARLFGGALQAELQAAARRGDLRRAPPPIAACRSTAGAPSRCAPIRCRGGGPCSTSATPPTSASARSAACRPRSSRRSACWPRASRTRSTTRPRSCWRTSRR